MNTDDWTALGAIAAAAGVVVTAVMAYWTTRKAAAAAADSADTAREVATIERDRWHRELTPELRFNLVRYGPNHLGLNVALDGPAGLDRLDTVTLTLLDDREHPAGPLTTDAHRAELPTVIWGPVRFSPQVDDVTEPGRETVIGALERGGHDVTRQLEDSRMPSWYRPQDWAREYLEEEPTVRMKAVCRLEGHHPWIIIAEVRGRLSVQYDA